MQVHLTLPAPGVCKQAIRNMLDFVRLNLLMPDASDSIGCLIALGPRFYNEGMAQINERILPHLEAVWSPNILPRVLPGYATLLWFTEEVSTDIATVHVICT